MCSIGDLQGFTGDLMGSIGVSRRSIGDLLTLKLFVAIDSYLVAFPTDKMAIYPWLVAFFTGLVAFHPCM